MTAISYRDLSIYGQILEHISRERECGADFDTAIIPEGLVETVIQELDGVKIHVSRYIPRGTITLVDSKQTIQFGSYQK